MSLWSLSLCERRFRPLTFLAACFHKVNAPQPFGSAFMQVGQKGSQQADGRQIGANVIDEDDAGQVG
jgi:hypothetical protein